MLSFGQQSGIRTIDEKATERLSSKYHVLKLIPFGTLAEGLRC